MSLNKNINSFLDNLQILEDLENSTNINKKTWCYGIIITFCFILYYISGMGIVANLVGFMYPAYKSFKSLRTKEKTDDEQWLTYWIVYSFFNLVEIFTSVIFNWIPFYYQLKLMFLVWLYHDSTRGAQIIYKAYLEKIIIKYENKIDEKIAIIKETVDEQIEKTVEGAIEEQIEKTVEGAIEEIIENSTESKKIN